ncbi:MAG: PilZ domain-containing protein [Deltaproteobacteria bacterium]|nr:PilZ domain-containing protein [Deltaproteobacteria bacterium]
MKKESLICFRASKTLHEAMSKIAKQERRSLSSMIEIALMNFLKEKNAINNVNSERRRYPRKQISIPAFINHYESGHYESGKARLNAASLMDLSLGGLKISIPIDAKVDVQRDGQTTKFQIIFTLPNDNIPISLDCEPRHESDCTDGVYIGAVITDADFKSYKKLQSYLM